MRAPRPDQHVDELEASPGLLLARLGHGAMELYRDSLAGTGLKPPHVAALVALRAGQVGQQALGEATGLDAVKLVGILNDLEACGLVERRRNALDRRRHIVAITCAGRARLEEVERLSATAEDRLLAGLSPAQREQLATLLRLVMASTAVAESCPGTTESANGDAAVGLSAPGTATVT